MKSTDNSSEGAGNIFEQGLSALSDNDLIKLIEGKLIYVRGNDPDTRNEFLKLFDLFIKIAFKRNDLLLLNCINLVKVHGVFFDRHGIPYLLEIGKQALLGPSHYKNILFSIWEILLALYHHRSGDIFWKRSDMFSKGDRADVIYFFRDFIKTLKLKERSAVLNETISILQKKMITSWFALIAILDLSKEFPNACQPLLKNIFINLALLQKRKNPGLAEDSSDLQHTTTFLRKSLDALLEKVSMYENNNLYLILINIVRLLPNTRDDGLVDRIRSYAETFDEDRVDNDPYRPLANSIRIAIHRKPSPNNIVLIENYLKEQEHIKNCIAQGKPINGTVFTAPDTDDMIYYAGKLLEILNEFWNKNVTIEKVSSIYNEMKVVYESHFSPEMQMNFDKFIVSHKRNNYLEANYHLTRFRRDLKEVLFDTTDGSFRYNGLVLQNQSDLISFAMQSVLVNIDYKNYNPENLSKYLHLLSQIVLSVRAIGAGDKEMGRVGRNLENENKAPMNIYSVRLLCKELVTSCKRNTDFMYTSYSTFIHKILCDYKHDITQEETDAVQISIYNYLFRGTSLLHLGDFAAHLSQVLKPFEDTEIGFIDEQKNLFWRFYGKQTPLKQIQPRVLKYIVGGKGSSLLLMNSLGLNVPEGFVLSTEVAKYCDHHISDEYASRLKEELLHLENFTGKKLGYGDDPLLVSVRSGAPISMPGMMDTILNVGMNDSLISYMRSINNPKLTFWIDCYIHLIYYFTKSICERNEDNFIDEMKRIFSQYKEHQNDPEITSKYHEYYLDNMIECYKKITGTDFPQDPYEQISAAVIAIVRSWKNHRAMEYRRINHIPEFWGTAVTIQRMVYGNLNDRSCSGVLFTRNPQTGKDQAFGNIIYKGQGEAVVSGTSSCQDITDLAKLMPQAYQELWLLAKNFELKQKVVQDIEFVIEDSKVFFLQSRPAELTTRAILRTLIDMVEKSIISKSDAVKILNLDRLQELSHPSFREEDIKKYNNLIIARGTGVYHGVACGRVVFKKKYMQELKQQSTEDRIIFVAEDTTTEDISFFYKASGVATLVGGPTSHAAINARILKRVCLVGCFLDVERDPDNNIISITGNGMKIVEGDIISLDANRGIILKGQYEIIPRQNDGNTQAMVDKFTMWTHEINSLEGIE
jgi:phosphohistidine swiveling domain-containing protein